MEKRARTAHPIEDLLALRWSPRAFADRSLGPEEVGSLFEAARWAPSSYNEQPWSFVVALREEREDFERLLGCLVPGNAAWAGAAPLLFLSVARLAFQRNGKPNRHAFHDVGLAVANLVVQAQAMGLAVHQMAGFDVEKARRDLRIPEGHEPVAMAAVGYPGDPASLPEKLREHEGAARTRRELADLVHRGVWG